AAMVGRHYIEQLAHIPAEVENASEFRYREYLGGKDTLVIAVTQSGETVDTLAGMEEAKHRGLKQIAICNSPGSQATRLADYTVLLRCSPEIAVASTKTLVSSMACLYMLALWLGNA